MHSRLFLLFLLISCTTFSQQATFDKVNIRNTLKLKANSITAISTDLNSTDSSDNDKLATAKAVADWVRANTGAKNLQQTLDAGNALNRDNDININNTQFQLRSDAGGSSLFRLALDNDNAGSHISAMPTGLGFDVSSGNNYTGIGINLYGNGIEVTDQLFNMGLYYSANYAANGASNPRWIPDISYVNSVVSSGWKYSGNTGTNPATHFLGTTDNVAMVMRTNNAERMRIAADGKVGIGTSNPLAKLHINSFAGTTPTMPIGTNLVLQNNLTSSQQNAITIISGSSTYASVYFGDGDDAGIGAIKYENTTNSFRFHTNNTEAMRITSSQNVGIGTGAPQARLHINGNIRVDSLSEGNNEDSLVVWGQSTHELQKVKNPADIVTQLSGNTFNETPFDLALLELPDGHVGIFDLTITAENTSNNDVLGGEYIATVKRIGGTYTFVNTSLVFGHKESSLAVANWSVATSGGVPVVQVTGIPATNISWTVSYTRRLKQLTYLGPAD